MPHSFADTASSPNGAVPRRRSPSGSTCSTKAQPRPQPSTCGNREDPTGKAKERAGPTGHPNTNIKTKGGSSKTDDSARLPTPTHRIRQHQHTITWQHHVVLFATLKPAVDRPAHPWQPTHRCPMRRNTPSRPGSLAGQISSVNSTQRHKHWRICRKSFRGPQQSLALLSQCWHNQHSNTCSPPRRRSEAQAAQRATSLVRRL